MNCSYCQRPFAEANALYQHTRAKHGRDAAAGLMPVPEKSMAEELTDAIVAFKCGEPVDEYLLTMFPDAFE